MKLLIVCQYFYPEPFRVSDVCFQLADMGHGVTVITGLPNYPEGEIYSEYQENPPFSETIQGVKVYRGNLRPRKKGIKNLARNYLSFIFQGSRRVFSSYKEIGRVDHILVFQYSPVTMAIPALLYQKIAGKRNGKKIPLSIYCFDLWPESIVSAGLKGKGLLYTIVRHLSRWIYSRADQILISSKQFQEYFQLKLGLKGPFHHLPVYAEELFLKSSNSDESTATKETESDGVTRLLFAGNIGEMQSIDTILKAASLLKAQTPNGNDTAITSRLEIHFVGDGSALPQGMELAQLEGLDQSTNPAVFFHGRHPVTDMPKFYELADAFLVTLKADPFISYTLPGKVQSYMAAGKPIIGAINGETAQVIEESGCGICVPAEDYIGLAKAFDFFSQTNKETRQKYGESGLGYYTKNFSSEIFFKNIIKHLSSEL